MSVIEFARALNQEFPRAAPEDPRIQDAGAGDLVKREARWSWALLVLIGALSLASAEAQDTDIPGVTASLNAARQYDGVLHVSILLHNAGGKDVAVSKALDYADVHLIDRRANRKLFPLKDANGHFLAGPVADWNGGGRWFLKLPRDADTMLWVLFDPVASGAAVTIEVPFLQPFADVRVSEGPPASGAVVPSGAPPIRARVESATRANGQLVARLRIENPGTARASGPAISYRDVYALDARGKRAYPLLKDSDGLFLAQPQSDRNEGGRWFLSGALPGQPIAMTLTFQAPPDDVSSVDVIVPRFAPFEAVAISGSGGAQPGGIGVAGRSVELQAALKDLAADVTPQQIHINLAADVLFDFDQAVVKPEAEPSLMKVVTVLKSYPGAQVSIEGHTDAKGNDAYNQGLSERRATAVAQWLAAHANLRAADVHTRGWGRTKPIAPNTKPDGSDDPAGRARNRRVEITVTKP
jgi:outer membrane protein OmpA-like peptidoglycan-associated protein